MVTHFLSSYGEVRWGNYHIESNFFVQNLFYFGITLSACEINNGFSECIRGSFIYDVHRKIKITSWLPHPLNVGHHK